MSVLIPTMIGKHHLKLDMPGEFSNKVLQKCLTTTLPTFEHVYQMKQFRRQNRANINNQRERSYYYEGRLVAKNRKDRIEQKDDSLETWYQKIVQQYGEKEAERRRSVLQVKRSTRHYNTPGRVAPGAVFYYNGERHVLNGQITNGQYFKAVGDAKTNYPAKKYRIRKQNEGLVFLG
mgnify:CR=1 FL=1